MKTLAKYHVCNHSVIDEKTFKNIFTGPGKLPGLSRNGPQRRFHAGMKTHNFCYTKFGAFVTSSSLGYL